MREALRLNPNLAQAHEAFAGYLLSVQRPEEALEEAHRAQELDPEGNHETEVFMVTGQYDRAIDHLRKYLELHPDDGFVYIDHGGVIDAYAFKGMHRESVEALAQAWRLFGFKEIGQGIEGAYKTSGYEGAYGYSAQQMERLYAEGKVYKPDFIAEWYARSGDKEQAVKWLAIANSENNHCPVFDLPHDPDFAFLYSDSRFQKLVKSTELRQ
jgi:tetratricopeptide (TPR) repeat protein